MPSSAELLYEQLAPALDDGGRRQLRIECCTSVAEALDRCGRMLWGASWVLRNKRGEALAIVTEVAGELALSACTLYSNRAWYAGGALVRSLIETEYLLYLFAHEDHAAEKWLTSSPEQIRKLFSPAQIRRRCTDQFRDSEYWAHCDIGGHPSPMSRQLLRDHSFAHWSHNWLWLDLAQHLSRVWPSFLQSVLRLGVANYLEEIYLKEEVVSRADEAIMAWRSGEAPELLKLSIPTPEGAA